MVQTKTAGQRILDEVTSWGGVTVTAGSRGETSIRVGRKELGHLHGDAVLHAGFPIAIWHELHDQGRIDYHPVFPGKPGYASRQIENESDVSDVIELLRINYTRAAARRSRVDPESVASTST
jgi:hypothetical protein